MQFSLSQWDLNLVWSILPFSSLKLSKKFPSRSLHEVLFLAAITSACKVLDFAVLSCKEPYLVLPQKKVVLRPLSSFLPKFGFYVEPESGHFDAIFLY